MFCSKCGKEIPEGMDTCPACNPVAEEVKAEEVVNADTAPAEEAAPAEGFEVNAEAAPAEEGFAEPDFEEPKKAKKGKKGLIIGGSIGLVIAALVAVVLFNLTYFKGLWIKTFGSDEDYFSFVEKSTMSQFVDTATNAYGEGLDRILEGAYGSEAEIELNISDEAIALIKEALPAEYKDLDLKNFKNFSIAINSLVDGNKQSADLKLSIGDTSLIDVNAIIDGEGEDMYLSLPGLTDKFIKFEDVFALAYGEDTAESLLADLDTSKLAEMLPSDEDMNSILNRYLEIAFDSFDKVTKGSEVVEVGTIGQELTTLTVKVTEKDCVKAAKAMLNELKNDEDFKDIIENIDDFVFEEYGELLEGTGYEKGTLYQTFRSAVSVAAMSMTDLGSSEEELFSLVDYVNSKHEIVGRAVELGGERLGYYATVLDGKDMAFIAEVPAVGVKIVGEGTNKSDVVTADYTVIVEDEEVLEFSLEEFDFGTLKDDGRVNGSVTVSLPAEALADAFDIDSSMISMVQPAVKLTFVDKGDEGSIKLAVLSKKVEYVSLTISGKYYDADSIKVPTDAVDSTSVKDWLNTVDLKSLADKIKKLGLPSEITSALDEAVEGIEEFGGLGSFVEEYAAMMEDLNNSYNDYYGDDYYSDYAY